MRVKRPCRPSQEAWLEYSAGGGDVHLPLWARTHGSCPLDHTGLAEVPQT